MRFSIVLAIAVLGTFAVLYIRSLFGENAVVVFGLLGFYAVYMFFKYVVNT